jgi:hypothetical protein
MGTEAALRIAKKGGRQLICSVENAGTIAGGNGLLLCILSIFIFNDNPIGRFWCERSL